MKLKHRERTSSIPDRGLDRPQFDKKSGKTPVKSGESGHYILKSGNDTDSAPVPDEHDVST